MKGKIDSNGWLQIKRGDRFKIQFCFRDSRDSHEPSVRCGDWCPAFREPIMRDETYSRYAYAELELCFGTLELELFKDERE